MLKLRRDGMEMVGGGGGAGGGERGNGKGNGKDKGEKGKYRKEKVWRVKQGITISESGSISVSAPALTDESAYGMTDTSSTLRYTETEEKAAALELEQEQEEQRVWEELKRKRQQEQEVHDKDWLDEQEREQQQWEGRATELQKKVSHGQAKLVVSMVEI